MSRFALEVSLFSLLFCAGCTAEHKRKNIIGIFCYSVSCHVFDVGQFFVLVFCLTWLLCLSYRTISRVMHSTLDGNISIINYIWHMWLKAVDPVSLREIIIENYCWDYTFRYLTSDGEFKGDLEWKWVHLQFWLRHKRLNVYSLQSCVTRVVTVLEKVPKCCCLQEM